MNPVQKAGNTRRRTGKKRMTRKDYHTKKIARMEAKKVLAKKVESKVYDQNIVAFAADAAGTAIFDLTSGIVRGTGENDFIGDSIQPSHLRIRWVLEGADNYNILRVVVIQNKAGGVPLGPTLFQSSGGINSPLSPYDTNYNETYRVLHDEFYSTVSSPTALTPVADSVITGDIRIPAKKLHKMTFTTAAALSSGGIYLVFISDSTVAPHPPGRFYSRLYFKDA